MVFFSESYTSNLKVFLEVVIALDIWFWFSFAADDFWDSEFMAEDVSA